MFTERLQSGYFPVTYCGYNEIKVRGKNYRRGDSTVGKL